jgi:hypothetical protein
MRELLIGFGLALYLWAVLLGSSLIIYGARI